jgi:hypothetical protein
MVTTRFFGRVCLPEAASPPTVPLAPTERLVIANAALAPGAIGAAPTTLLVRQTNN